MEMTLLVNGTRDFNCLSLVHKILTASDIVGHLCKYMQKNSQVVKLTQ